MNLLDVVIFAPLVGFLILLLVPRSQPNASRMGALIISLIVFVISLFLIPQVANTPGNDFKLVTDLPWINYPPIRYHVGVDGLSLWLVILTTFLTPLAVLVSWKSIDHRMKEFYAFMLLLEFGLIGVFLSLDLFLFYVFWEISLVPMYFLIGIWGHDRRIYAAVKFFLYTMAGSVLMLAAIIYLYNVGGTFDYTVLLRMIERGDIRLSFLAQTLLFLAFFFAFAIKVPLFPLHTWLPDAHVEAPTAGSVMLASVMLKMGTYGLVRFCLPMFPNAARQNADWIVALGITGIIYGALVAMVQPNMKKLVAYSSVSHLGFVVLGIFSFTQYGLDGAGYQMLNHGISTGALFILVGMMYERRHSLEIVDYGGVATPAPWLATFFLITTLASIGLPALNNFIGEYLVLQGASAVHFQWAIFAAIGVIFSACYMLWLYQRTFLGRAPGAGEEDAHAHGHGHAHDTAKDHALSHDAGHGDAHADSHDQGPGHAGHGWLPDLSLREWAILVPLVAMMVWMGVAPNTFLPSIGSSNAKTLEQSKINVIFQVKNVSEPRPQGSGQTSTNSNLGSRAEAHASASEPRPSGSGVTPTRPNIGNDFAAQARVSEPRPLRSGHSSALPADKPTERNTAVKIAEIRTKEPRNAQ